MIRTAGADTTSFPASYALRRRDSPGISCVAGAIGDDSRAMAELSASQASASFDPHDALTEASWVRRLARGLVNDRTRADDVEQETWLAILRQRGRRVGELRAWTAAVARARAIDERRSEQRRSRREQDAAQSELQPSVEELSARADQMQRLMALVSDLDEIYREVVLRHYFDGQRLDEIARASGLPPTTVRTRLARALDMLRERLDRECRGDRTQWMGALAPLAALPGTPLSFASSATQLVCASLFVVGASVAAWWWWRDGGVADSSVAFADSAASDRSRAARAAHANEPQPSGERALPELGADSVADVEARHALLVFGKFVDDSGQPISRGQIFFERESQASIEGSVGEIGTWAALDVPSGTWQLRAQADGCAPLERAVEIRADGDVQRIDLELVRAPQLSMHLVDPLERALDFGAAGALDAPSFRESGAWPESDSGRAQR